MIAGAVLGIYFASGRGDGEYVAGAIAGMLLLLIPNIIIFPIRYIRRKIKERERDKIEKEMEALNNMTPEQLLTYRVRTLRSTLSSCNSSLVYAQNRGDLHAAARLKGEIAELESKLRELGA